MIEYLLSLSLLIVVVLLVRTAFRKTVSPRAIYALWFVVVIRMFLPITLFEVDLPDLFHARQTEQMTQDSETEVGDKDQSPETELPQTTPINPSQSNTTVTPEYPSVIVPVTPVTPTVPSGPSPIPPTISETGKENLIFYDTPPIDAPNEPIPTNWRQAANLIWLIGAVVSAVWVLFTGITYNRRLVKNRVLYRTVRCTKVYISENAGVPCISGIIPSIYITPAAVNSKSETLIIVHEHIHIRHLDHIWSIVRAIALIVFWWNPLVWVAARVSKQDAELACDDAISAKLNDDGRLKYANILLETIPQKHRYAVGLGSAPMKERILMLINKQKNRWICLILALVLAVIAVGCSFIGTRKITMDKIQAQNGFIILSQETKEVKLTLPLEQLPTYNDIVSSEEARLEVKNIPVFTTETTEVFLHTVGVSENNPKGTDRDVLYLGFDIRHTLRDSGTVYTVHRVLNDNGSLTYTPEVSVTKETLKISARNILHMESGPEDNFYLYIDSDLYTGLRGKLDIGITLNEIVYERGSEVKEYSSDDPVLEPVLPDNFAQFYHEAEAIYAMFTKYRSDIYFGGTTYVDGIRYCVVNISAIMSFDKLSEYCEQYFDSGLTEKLISTTVENNYPLFSVIDGWLHRVDNYTADFEYDVGHDYTMTLVSCENGVCTVRVDASMTHNNHDIYATAFCSYALNKDGEIRFISFELMAEKFNEILMQIPDDPEPQEPFDPNQFAELIPNSSAERLFWHQIAGTDDYLYFCAIRTINSTMTSYTDDPPKDFVIYRVNSTDRQIYTLENIHGQLPEDLKYDTVCPVVAMTGFGSMSCRFILQMTDGDRMFYVAFDNYDNLQDHLSFTYRGILSDEEVNELKEKYPVSIEKASKYYMGVPKEWSCFEYGGVQYDLSKIYSEVNGVGEWGHIGKYVVAQGHINPNDSLYVLINTETQKIEHYFVGTVLTYHSDDINTIVYARGNTVRSFDGTFLVDLVLVPDEYIRKLEYSEDKTQITVTIETKDSSMRTATIDLSPVDNNPLPGNIDDELALRYLPFSGIVGFTPGDGSVFEKRYQDLVEATDAFFSEYANDMASSPPLMYYLVHRMGLSKAEMYDFYSPNVLPPLVDYLFIEDVEEAKRALMMDCAFYSEGKVYSFYEVYRAEMAGEPLFDITASDHAATWWDIYDYLMLQKLWDEHGNPHSPYIEYLPYVEKILRENFATITDLDDWEMLGLSKVKNTVQKNQTYSFLWNLLSGESEIPEYNELGIKDYSLTRIYDAGGTTIEFTFTVTGDSLPETLPPGTYTKIVRETLDISIHEGKVPETMEEYEEENRINKGLDRFGDNPAVQAVNTYLPWMRYIYEVSPYGEWDMTNPHLPYNYICAYYGKNLEISFSVLQRLMSEKFGIWVERPEKNNPSDQWLNRCAYDEERDIVYYADTRGHKSAHRIIDVHEDDYLSEVTVQLFADSQYLIPSHKVVYRLWKGEVFLNCEIIQTGKYEPLELR